MEATEKPRDDDQLMSVETLTGLHYVPQFRGITPMHVIAIVAPAIPSIIFSFVLPVLPYQLVLLLFVAAFVLMVTLQWKRHPTYWLRVFQRGDLPPVIYRVLASPLVGLKLKASAAYLTPFDKGEPQKTVGLDYLDLRRHHDRGQHENVR